MSVLASMNPVIDEERQRAEAAHISRLEAHERHREPINESEAARLNEVHAVAQESYLELGRLLYAYIAIRNRCESDELDDALRIRAQQLIDDLQPRHKSAEAAFIAARDEDLSYRCGGTK